jgi:CRISPR-associated protein Csm4
MKELLVHIKPISEFPSLHSDRLFGSICYAINEIYGEEKLTNMIDNFISFQKEPPFLISSAFPYIDNDNRIYFLPRPIENPNIYDSNIHEQYDYRNYIDNYKTLKNAKYVSTIIFNDLINGKMNDANIIKNMSQYDIKSGLLFPKDNTLKFSIGHYDVPRNRINRPNNISDSIFYFEGYYYRGINLFFIVRIYDQKYEELLKESLKFLESYRGFGRDISSGKGKFNIEDISENKLLNISKNPKKFVTLSRYIPSIDEINIFKTRKNIFYEIGTKRGMIAGDKPKKQIQFFSEGSTFPNLKDIYGKIVYVHDKAIEYGLAFNIGIST